jgi:hypothetical protein
MDKILTKKQLLREIQRFLRDKNRGISKHLFADLCGISYSLLRDTFELELTPMSETTQIRVSRGFAAFQRGEVATMMNRDGTVFVDYRKEAKPVYKKSTSLQLENGQFKIKVGLRNAADYSQLSIDEQLGESMARVLHDYKCSEHGYFESRTPKCPDETMSR